MFDLDLQHALLTPFPSSVVKKRKQDYTNRKTGEVKSMQFDYVETGVVIARLNAVFGFAWSFRIEHSLIEQSQVIVMGTLASQGECKTDFGGALIGSGEEAVVNAYKSAASDTLKRCARQFGVGLELWMDDPVSAPLGANGRPEAPSSPERQSGEAPDPFATERQMGALRKIAARLSGEAALTLTTRLDSPLTQTEASALLTQYGGSAKAA